MLRINWGVSVWGKKLLCNCKRFFFTGASRIFALFLWFSYLPFCLALITGVLVFGSWAVKESMSVWSFVPELCSCATCRLTVGPGPWFARPSPSCFLMTWRSVERVPCWSSVRNAAWKLIELSACFTCILTRSHIPTTALSGPVFASIFCRLEGVKRGI